MKLFPFFNRIGIIVVPYSIIGWLLIAAMVSYSVYEFIDIDSRSHSVSDTLINFVFNVALNAIVLYILALVTSRKVQL